jgi:hypothetical protein
MRRLIRSLFILSLTALFVPALVMGQTGNISGQVTEAETGQPLPGVNVVIEGTTQGATTNADGYYRILNVAPGSYTLRATFVGYADQVIEEVRVNIDLTTTIDIQMQEQAVGLDEVVVQSQEPVVKPDISANVANLTAEGMENIPVAGIDEVISLQAGIEPGMSVRGGGQDELSFMVDGMSMRDGRTNSPFTGVSYTSVQEVQVQTGGFNAEYGNVRSGLINVVTKEGPRDRYTVDVLTRYSPPQKKYFGTSPGHEESYFIRPYLDDQVAWDGTDNWDRYTREQYPNFEGWEAVADGREDLTAEQAQEVFLWQHRKSFKIDDPDYTLDASFGGPVPVVSDMLGDLRFFASYRGTQSAYVVPMRRSAYRDYMGQLKVTSNISPGLKVNLHGMFSEDYALASNPYGSGFRGEMPSYPWSGRGMVDNLNEHALFSLDEYNPQDITRVMGGIDLTHTLSASTFYEMKVQRMATDYFTRPGPPRDSSVVRTIGGMELTEAPFGWVGVPDDGLGGLSMGPMGEERDTSTTALWNASFDITSQLAPWNQMKGGLEFSYGNYQANYGNITSWVHADPPIYTWTGNPRQGAAYLQNKLEFEGLIANVGLRLDYFDAGGTWYEYSPYSRAFAWNYDITDPDDIEQLEDIEAAPPEKQLNLSPRLGISFPITTDSKLFFNYGHFRQTLDPHNIYSIGRQPGRQAVDNIGNPNHRLPQTISYELGYEQNVFEQLLLRVTGYYKDVRNQPRSVQYTSIDGQVDYTRLEPHNYEDIRGFEVSLNKNRGRWVRGFLNYTYMASKAGYFGEARQFEHTVQQRSYERTSSPVQWSAVPEPYARANLELLTPPEYGPTFGGVHLLGDWHLNWLAEWRAGQVFTWRAGADIPEINNNAQWNDYYNLDLRLSKDFTAPFGEAKLYVDISNVFNLKHMHRTAGFEGSRDFERYMMSLHLPEDVFDQVDQPPYEFIPGDDQPGDSRKEGVEWVPIELVRDVSAETDAHERPLYYETESQTYHNYEDGSWEEADPDRVEQVLEDKAYIDMPNESYFTFLNPRHVMFGVRITL